MSILSDIVALFVAPLTFVLLLPALSELASRVFRLFRRFDGIGVSVVRQAPRLCFVVPAHNEETMIGRCVRSLMAMSTDNVYFDLFVLADNCTDATAARAAAYGARVLERQDPVARGKPQALRWAMEQLPLSTYDAIVIVDADSVVRDSYASALAAHTPLRDKAVQSYNGVANRNSSWLSRLAGLLITVRYDGMFVEKTLARLNCPLANGMLIGTRALERIGWPADSLTENWEVYARLTVLGIPIEYASAARLGSHQAEALSQSSIQRRRWQAGRWQVLRTNAGPLLRSRAIGWRQKLDAIAELTYPGPVVHATLAIGSCIVLLLLPSTMGHVLVGLLTASLLPQVAWTIWAIHRERDRGMLLLALGRLPFYGVWRLVVLLRSIVMGRRAAWLRSPRHSTESS